MHANEVRPEWAVNDLCKVIVGFRNYSTHATRSKYVSFAVIEQPQMCRLLVRLSQGRVDADEAARYPAQLFEQLLEYGFLAPLDSLGWRGHCKRLGRVLDSGRWRRIPWRGRHYYVTSLVFMAFYAQGQDEYLKESVILPAWFPNYADKVLQIVGQGLDDSGYLALSGSVRRRLRKHGLVTPPEQLPNRERFFAEHCVLSQALVDELPDYYRAHLPAVDDLAPHYVLNPGIHHTLDNAPAAVRRQIPNRGWARACVPTLWVEDPVKGIVSMYWLDDVQARLLAELQAGSRQVRQLDPHTLRLFVYSGILHDPRELPARRDAWQQRLSALGERLDSDGCMTFESVLSPIELAIGRKYLRFMMEGKYLLLDRVNGKTQERFWCHRDEFTFYLQGQVCALLNQVLDKPVKPGHNALTIYGNGATLPRHRDDVLAFSWVMSLPIEARPEARKEQAWPIYVETPTRVHKALLQSGDGHLIDPQMPHWREQLVEGRLGILFLWFVPQDYRGFVNGSWVD